MKKWNRQAPNSQNEVGLWQGKTNRLIENNEDYEKDIKKIKKTLWKINNIKELKGNR
jgi:DNA-binding ferritin-like protein (Dps family)